MAWAVRTLLGMFKVFSLRTLGPGGWEEKIALQQKLFRLEAKTDDSLGRSGQWQAPNAAIPCVYFLTHRDFVMLDRIISVGFDPSAIQWHADARLYLSEFTNRAVARSTIMEFRAERQEAERVGLSLPFRSSSRPSHRCRAIGFVGRDYLAGDHREKLGKEGRWIIHRSVRFGSIFDCSLPATINMVGQARALSSRVHCSGGFIVER